MPGKTVITADTESSEDDIFLPEKSSQTKKLLIKALPRDSHSSHTESFDEFELRGQFYKSNNEGGSIFL